MTTILLLTANPQNNAHLQLEKEIREIEQAIEHSKFGSQINFKPRRAVRLRDLLSHLEKEQPDIVHFSGHGNESSELMLLDEQGNNFPLRKDAIQQIFSLLRGKTRCVVLNACYTEPVANAIGENIDCAVVGMIGDVKDETAIDFAREFYGQLANGKDVSRAFLLAKSHAPEESTRLVSYKVDTSTMTFVQAEPVPSWWIRWSKVLTFAAIALCVIVLFVLMFWNQIVDNIPPRDPTVVITIGVVTAPYGSAFAIGEQQRKGIKIAEEYFYNKMGYKIVTVDGYSEEAKQKSELEGAKEAFNKLVTEDVLAIIGPTLSSQALQVDSIANDNGIPVVAISNTHPKMRGFGDYILRISAGVEEFMPQVINHVAAHETVRKAIVLYLDEPDSFTIPECESARSALLRDTKIEVASKNIPYTSIVAKSSEERMKVVESVLSYEPDLIVICGLTNDGVELIKSLKEKDESGAARYQGIIIGGNALNTPSLLSLCAGLCKGLYLAQAYDYTNTSELNRDFLDYYARKSPESPTPTQFAAQAFTGVHVIVKAIEQIENINQLSLIEKREALREFLKSNRRFDTLLGNIKLEDDGDVDQSNFVIIQVNENNEMEIR